VERENVSVGGVRTGSPYIRRRKWVGRGVTKIANKNPAGGKREKGGWQILKPGALRKNEGWSRKGGLRKVC